MDEKHPNNIDPRPKRRKDRDNPYEIYSVGIQTDHPHFYVSFTDSLGIRRELEISKSLFETLDRFELDDLSFLNEWDRHCEHSESTEASLNARAGERMPTVEDEAMQHIQSERLHKAIAALPEKQRSRLVLYYFEGLTYAEIAEREGCTHPAVIKSISTAIEKIKKFLGE